MEATQQQKATKMSDLKDTPSWSKVEAAQAAIQEHRQTGGDPTKLVEAQKALGEAYAACRSEAADGSEKTGKAPVSDDRSGSTGGGLPPGPSGSSSGSSSSEDFETKTPVDKPAPKKKPSMRKPASAKKSGGAKKKK